MANDSIDQQHDPEALLTHAQKALDDCLPDLARKFLLRALQIRPDHVPTLETLGVTEMEDMVAAGESGEEQKTAECAERAYQYFLRAATVNPDEGYEKYLYLGQLTEGKDALEFYRRGVVIMEKLLGSVAAGSEEERLIRRKLSDVLCSMTETYMTDCCDEPEAESCCDQFATNAIKYDPSNPEAHQTLASVRMSQCRPDEARAAIETSMDTWFKTARVGDTNWPAYPARVALAKILLELALHERALAVLQTLQDENDEDPEAWYLYGWCYYRMGGGGEDTASIRVEDQVDAWDNAKDCFESVIQLHERFGNGDEVIEHTQQLLEEITPFVDANGHLLGQSGMARVPDVAAANNDAMEI
ncbi:hypothetical protein BC832DRAFT_553214 [Gaertneriomyces semiglobifer]|nr:hypothetical protein BC832DRAFT_553214 [Gaertneriomyces semiglobifer]